MKKILFFLGTITLIGTITTSLVACNTPQEYTLEELSKIKEQKNIKTNDGILEWIAPQEKPLNEVDNKWYFVVWHGNVNDDWKIIKFKYDDYEKNKVIDEYNNYNLQLFQTGKLGQGYWKEICLVDNNWMPRYFAWSFYPNYFKSVYRWNNDDEPNKDVENKLKSYLCL